LATLSEDTLSALCALNTRRERTLGACAARSKLYRHGAAVPANDGPGLRLSYRCAFARGSPVDT